MRLDDYIRESVSTYPSLFWADSPETTRWLVLDHVFGTLGNGLAWAHTKRPNTGGYLCEPRYRTHKGEQVRIYDKPYGLRTYAFDLLQWYASPLVGVYYKPYEDTPHKDLLFMGLEEDFKKHTNKKSWENDPKVRIIHNFGNFLLGQWTQRIEFVHGKVPLSLKFLGIAPYAYFEKTYSRLWEKEPQDIKDDWREGALWWVHECQEFFEDTARLPYYRYYPTEKHIRTAWDGDKGKAKKAWEKHRDSARRFLTETENRLLNVI